MTFADDIAEFLVRQVVDPSAEKTYLRALRDNPFVGSPNVARVKADFAGDKNLLDIIRQDTEETRGILPDFEEFRLAVLPFFTEEAGKVGSYKTGARRAYDVDERLAQAGLVRPYGTMLRGSAKKPVFGESVEDLLKRGMVEPAVRAQYQALENMAQMTPASMVRAAAEQGEPFFYPLRSLRNTTIAAQTGLPKDIIDLGSSIGSMQAGPYMEANRVLAALPFLRVGKNGKAVFDEEGFVKVYGKTAAQGPGAKQLREELVRAAEDPNFLSRAIGGISDKTGPYNQMALLPNSQVAYVDDSIMESVLTGASSGGLPGNAMASMYSQMPGRVLAQLFGTSPSIVQEAAWFTPRIVKGRTASAVPFERNIRDSMIDDVLSGRVGRNPNSPNPNLSETEEISARLRRYLGDRGQLVDPEFAALANEVRVPANLEPGLSVRDIEFEGRPVRVVTPEDTLENAMAFKSRKFADRYKAALDAVKKLGPSPDPQNVAVILAAFGIPLAALSRGGNGEIA